LPCLAPRGACVHPIRRCRRIVCMIDHDGLILILAGTTGTSFDRFPSFSPDSLIPSSDPAARSDEDRLRSPCCQAWRSSNRPMHRPVCRAGAAVAERLRLDDAVGRTRVRAGEVVMQPRPEGRGRNVALGRRSSPGCSGVRRSALSCWCRGARGLPFLTFSGVRCLMLHARLRCCRSFGCVSGTVQATDFFRLASSSGSSKLLVWQTEEIVLFGWG